MPPPRGHNAVIGVRRPSVRLMSRTSALTRKPKGLGRWNFAQGYSRSHATPTPTSRSNGQKSRWGGGILWRRPSRTTCLYMLSHCYNNSSTNQLFLDVTRFSAKFGKTPFNYLASTVCNGLSLNIRLSPCNSSLISEPRSDRSPVKCHVKFCIYKKISYRREAA